MCGGVHNLVLVKVFKPYFNGGFFRKRKPSDVKSDVVDGDVIIHDEEVGGEIVVHDVDTNVVVEEVKVESQNIADVTSKEIECDANITVDVLTEDTVVHAVEAAQLKEEISIDVAPNNVENEDSNNGSEAIEKVEVVVAPRIIYDDDALPNENEESVGTFMGNARVKISVYIADSTLHACVESFEGLNFGDEKLVPKEIRFLITVPKIKYTLKTNWVQVGPSEIPALTFNIGPYNVDAFESNESAEVVFEMYGKQKTTRRCYGQFRVNPANIIGTESTVVYVKRVTPKPYTDRKRSITKSIKRRLTVH